MIEKGKDVDEEEEPFVYTIARAQHGADLFTESANWPKGYLDSLDMEDPSYNDADKIKGRQAMIRLQIIERHGAKLFQKLKEVMNTGELKTFVIQNRGKKVTHTNKNYPGWMNWSSYSGVITCEILSPRKPGEEWKLLGALIGRLSDKYQKEVHSINIQFE